MLTFLGDTVSITQGGGARRLIPGSGWTQTYTGNKRRNECVAYSNPQVTRWFLSRRSKFCARPEKSISYWLHHLHPSRCACEASLMRMVSSSCCSLEAWSMSSCRVPSWWAR